MHAIFADHLGIFFTPMLSNSYLDDLSIELLTQYGGFYWSSPTILLGMSLHKNQ